jgi:hypothetical protein
LVKWDTRLLRITFASLQVFIVVCAVFLDVHLVTTVLPLPIFHGITIPPMPSPGLTGGLSAQSVGAQKWGLPDADMQKFNEIFTKIVGSPSMPVMDGA